jgi:omega-6 fatty acid desaturase (delta-12 desaturase)
MEMRTGKDLVLATKNYANDDTARSWWYVLSTAALLAAAWAGTWWNFPLPVRIVCSLATGLLLLRMFVIYHDQQHHAILPRSRAAEVFMRAYGLLAISPSSVWRSSHNHHHSHNSRLRGSHIGSFPIMTRDQFERSSKSERMQYLFMRHPLTILFGYVFVFLWGMCVYPFLNGPMRHLDSLLALLCHLLLGATLLWLGGWTALALSVVGPYTIACALGSYLFYAQHNFPSVSFASHGGWTYERAAIDSSSFMKMGGFMNWVTANIGYHHLHHLNSRIPFYRLPEAMAALPELQAPRTTSLHPREVLRCLRLKVWDTEAQRMVSLSEAAIAKN